MENIKEYKGSFSQAFGEARKAGDKQFKWYNPKSKQMEIFAVQLKDPNAKAKTSTEKANINQQVVKNGKQQNRFTVKKQGDQFYIYDNQDFRVIGNSFKSAQEAQNFVKSDAFKDATANVVVTAARTKLNGNEQGFIPITSRTDLVDFNGNPRLYKNYTTGEYYVTDNYGNIIGKSTDSNVEQIGFNQFRKADGSLTDLKERGSVELTAQANRNEANQLARQKLERQILGEEGLKKDIQTARNNFATTVANMAGSSATMAEHATLGLLKMGMSAPGDKGYKFEDYVHGFNPVDGGDSHIYGLGSFLDLQNPYARVVGDALGNFTFVTSATKALNPTKVTGETKTLAGYQTRKLPNGEAGRGIRSGQVHKGGQITGQYTIPHGNNVWRSSNKNRMTQLVHNPNATKNHGRQLQAKFGRGSNQFMNNNYYTVEPMYRKNPITLTYRNPTRTVYGQNIQYKNSTKSNIDQPEYRQYIYTQGTPNPLIDKGYVNAWNSDKAYIPGIPRTELVGVINSYGFNTPYYSGETVGSGGFDSKQIPQLKTY